MKYFTSKRIYIVNTIISLFFSISISANALEMNEIPGNGESASSTDAVIDVSAEAAIVMDIDTGDILYDKNGREEFYVSSLSKILTSLVAMENAKLTDYINISSSIIDKVSGQSSILGFKADEDVMMKDALYALMMNSDRECGLAIADFVGGSEEGFAKLMNKKAYDLGCNGSYFSDVNGLFRDGDYSCCLDMAKIAKAAYIYPEFKSIISSVSYTMDATNKSDERVLWQENSLIYTPSEFYYSPAIGGKPSLGSEYGYSLVTFAEKDGRRLVAVILKDVSSDAMYRDTINLLDFSFDNYRICRPLSIEDIELLNDRSSRDNKLIDNYYKDVNHTLPYYTFDTDISFYVRSYVNDENIDKDISFFKEIDGKTAGTLILSYNGTYITEVPIMIEYPTVMASSTDAYERIQNTPKDQPGFVIWLKRIILILMIVILILLIIIIIVKIKKQINYHSARQSVRYFPRSRDARLNKKDDTSIDAKNNDAK